MSAVKLNWKKGPGYKQIEQINLPEYNQAFLDNGIKCIEINQGTQEIFKLDLVFKGARILEHKKLVSKFTSILMREGTQKFTSSEIAETVDFYGATLRISANLDNNFLSLSGLSKHLEKLMPIFTNVLYYPTFPIDEVEKSKRNGIQKLQMDLSKNELLNYRIFTEKLFGKDHFYGYNTEEQFINELSREDLVLHHSQAYGTDNCTILIGGKLPPDTMSILNTYLGQKKINAININMPETLVNVPHERIVVSSKNEHQASIRIGRKMFNRHHEDFTGMFVLNTILGGYFGSRLMTTIREDLGLTYNIYSVLDTMMFDGYFYIETDVAVDTVEKTISEIYNQLFMLQEELVSDDELNMVKNYIIGNFLNLVDGPLNTLSFLRSLEMDDVTKEDFDIMVKDIKNIDAETLQKLARKYFDKNYLIEVIVGA